MKLILASNSPRRKQLLEDAGYKFDIIVGDYDEKAFTDNPVITAKTFSLGKAQATFSILKDKNVLVLGADTVVYYNGKILGKAKTEKEAFETLSELSGKTHKVITGYALVGEFGKKQGYVETEVEFNRLSKKLINEYIESGLYKGKAGSYGIQDGFPLVKCYKGSLNNVIGLPIETLKPIIDELMK